MVRDHRRVRRGRTLFDKHIIEFNKLFSTLSSATTAVVNTKAPHANNKSVYFLSQYNLQHINTAALILKCQS